MGGAASIQELGADIEGIDDAEMSAKMKSVLDSLNAKGLKITEENFQSEAKLALNDKDFAKASIVAGQVKTRFEGKLSDNGGGTSAVSKKKRKKKRKKKIGKGNEIAVEVSAEYDVITGLAATVKKVIGFRESVKSFIGGLDVESVLTADEIIQERLSEVKKGTITKRAEKNGVVIELLAEAGCKKQINVDGSTLYQWSDGTLIKHAGNIYVMKLPTGNVVQYNENEHVKIFQHSDGVILQVQGSSDVVNVHDGSENEYMSKPSAKICAIEPIEEGEGYRLQYNGAGKKKSRFTMYTECSTNDSPTLILFDDGLYVVTYPGGDTLQRDVDGSYLFIDSKGRKNGRTADGAESIPLLTGRLPNNISEKWIGTIQEDVSPEQVIVDQACEIFVESEVPGQIPADIDVAVEEMIRLLDELTNKHVSKGEKRYYEALYNRIWRQHNGLVKASNIVAIVKLTHMDPQKICALFTGYITHLWEEQSGEKKPTRLAFVEEWTCKIKPRDLLCILRCCLCKLVGSLSPSDEVEGLPLLLVDTRSVSIVFAGRHHGLQEDRQILSPSLGPKMIKMRSLASELTLAEQDSYIPQFGMLDVDGDGTVEMASVLKVLECSGLSTSTQFKIIQNCLEGDPLRSMNALEYSRAMQLAGVAQEGENICIETYKNVTELQDELNSIAQIDLCRILDPIPPPSDLLPVVSKIIAKILKFYNKEKIPSFNNKLKILAYMEKLPMRDPEMRLSVALYRRIVRLNGGRPSLHELVHQLQHTKMSSLDIINAVAVSVIFTAQDMRVTTIRSYHVEVATQEVMERVFRLLACAQHCKGRSLKSLTLKETKTFRKIPLVILRAKKEPDGSIVDSAAGLKEEERECLAPRYESIDIFGDNDCPSVLVANDLQMIRGLDDEQCRQIFDIMCGAYNDDAHSITYRQYCVMMKMASLIQRGKQMSIDIAKQLDTANAQPCEPPDFDTTSRSSIGDWFAYMSDSSGSSSSDSEDSDDSGDDDNDDMLSGSESSEISMSESDDEDLADIAADVLPAIKVLDDTEAASIFRNNHDDSNTESKTSSPSSKIRRSKSRDKSNRLEEVIQVDGTLHIEGLAPHSLDRSTEKGAKLRNALKSAIVEASGINVEGKSGTEKYKIKIQASQNGLRNKVRYKLMLGGSRDAMHRAKQRLKDLLQPDESPSQAYDNPADGSDGSSRKRRGSISAEPSSVLGELIKKNATKRGVGDLVSGSVHNVKDDVVKGVRVTGSLGLNAGITTRDLAGDGGECIIGPLRQCFESAIAEISDVHIIPGKSLQATVVPGPDNTIRLEYEFTVASNNVGPQTSEKKAITNNTKAAQMASDVLTKLIAEAAQQDAATKEDSLADLLTQVVHGLGTSEPGNVNSNSLDLSSVKQQIHSNMVANADVTFLLSGSIKVRAKGLTVDEVTPPAPGGLGLAKMIAQAPPNVDTTGLRIMCNITGATETKERDCVLTSYEVRVTGPEAKSRVCIDAMAKALEKLKRQSKAADDGDMAAANQAGETLATQSSTVSRFIAELSDDPMLREFNVVGYKGIETRSVEDSDLTSRQGKQSKSDYDSAISGGGIMANALGGGAVSSPSRRGSITGGVKKGSSLNTPNANTAVVKGSFALDGCPRSLVESHTSEFGAAIQAGLERVLAANGTVCSAVESGVVTHRVKVTGLREVTRRQGDEVGEDTGESSTEVSFLVELQENGIMEMGGVSEEGVAHAQKKWNFIKLDASENHTTASKSKGQHRKKTSNKDLNLNSVVNAARESIAKALPKVEGIIALASASTSAVGKNATTTESELFLDQISAQYAAIQPDLKAATHLLTDLPIKVRATPTAIADTKSYKRVAAGAAGSSTVTDLSTAVEYIATAPDSLRVRKRTSQSSNLSGGATTGRPNRNYRMTSMLTETIVDGLDSDGPGSKSDNAGPVSAAVRETTCRAVELALHDVMTETASNLKKQDKNFDSDGIHFLSRVVACRQCGSSKKGVARGNNGHSACRLTVQTLVDHPSRDVVTKFSEAAKAAIDRVLETDKTSGDSDLPVKQFSEQVRRIATALAPETGTVLPVDNSFRVAGGDVQTQIGAVDLSSYPTTRSWSHGKRDNVKLFSPQEFEEELVLSSASSANPKSKHEGKMSDSSGVVNGAAGVSSFIPINSDLNVLNTLKLRVAPRAFADAVTHPNIREAIEKAITAGLARKSSDLPLCRVRVRAMRTDHDAGNVAIDYQVQPYLVSSACAPDVATALLSASQNLLSNEDDANNLMKHIVQAVEEKTMADRDAGMGGTDSETIAAAAKSISNVSQDKSNTKGKGNASPYLEACGPQLMITPHIDKQHVCVQGSFKTGPINQVLLDSGVAQRSIAKTLRGLPDPVQVAGLANDVRITGYTVDKDTAEVSFCYEARIEGCSDGAAGDAASAYAETLGAGATGFGTSRKGRVHAHKAAEKELRAFSHRFTNAFVDEVKKELEESVTGESKAHPGLQKLYDNPKLTDQLEGLQIKQLLPPMIIDVGGSSPALDAVVWRSGVAAAVHETDIAVNASIEMDGILANDVINDPVLRKAMEDSLVEMGLIDDEGIHAVQSRRFDVRIMNVADVFDSKREATRVGIQFHINSKACAEVYGAKSEAEQYKITSRLASKLKKRLAAVSNNKQSTVRLKKLVHGNLEKLRNARANAALLKANAAHRGMFKEIQVEESFPSLSNDVKMTLQAVGSNATSGGDAESEEREIHNWYSRVTSLADDGGASSTLSREKLVALRAIFHKYDINGNGRLGVQELMMVLQNLGYDGDHGEVAQKIIAKYAGDSDHLPFAGFCRWKIDEEAARNAQQDKVRSIVQGEVVLDSSFKYDDTVENSDENVMKKRAFCTALAEIPYDLGLKTTSDNVSVEFKRQKDGTVKVAYSISLQDTDNDPDILQEIVDEVRDSIGKNGGRKFMQVLRRKAKTLASLNGPMRVVNIDKWWENKLSVTASMVDVQEEAGTASRSHTPRDSPVTTQNESKTTDRGTSEKTRRKSIHLDGGIGFGSMARLKKKVSSLFKTLNGQIKLKGVSRDDFEGSDFMVQSLKEAFCAIICSTGILRSNMRIKLDTLDSVEHEIHHNRVTVGYRVRLRGDSRLFAEAVVQNLKVTFKDKDRRNAFLDSFWEHCGIPRPEDTTRSKKAKQEKREKREKRERKAREKKEKAAKREHSRKSKGKSKSSKAKGKGTADGNKFDRYAKKLARQKKMAKKTQNRLKKTEVRGGQGTTWAPPGF
jgi:Ca2+-binding EF-hand superfamily protein